ncbi:MAG: GNAT family N-acetyltransferase [Bryobacteraceae bacterium]
MPGIDAMEENLRHMLGAFGRAQAAGETRAFPGLAVCSSALNFAMFNGAVLTAPVETEAGLEQRIQTAAAYYGSRGLPWSIWVCEGWLERRLRPRTADSFYRSGLHLVVELPGMEAALLEPPVRPLPALEFRRVGDPGTRSAFNHIMAIAFGIPFAFSRQIYESERTWGGGLTGWVAYREGTAVATAAMLIAGGVIGVYAVGTLPQHQRKGCGEAVMRHALERAQAESGLECSVLQASAAGFHLYQRMGYRTITRYAVFAYS